MKIPTIIAVAAVLAAYTATAAQQFDDITPFPQTNAQPHATQPVRTSEPKPAPTKPPVTTGLSSAEQPKPAADKPILLINPGPTYTFGLSLTVGETRSLTLDQTVVAAGLTEKEVAEVALGKDQHALDISAKHPGATLLVLRTAEADSILILVDVAANSKKAEQHRARFTEIREVMTKSDAGRSANQSN